MTTETIDKVRRAQIQGEQDGLARRQKHEHFDTPEERRAYDHGYSNGVRMRIADPRTMSASLH